MENVSGNYWVIIESLHFPVVGGAKEDTLGEEQRLKDNLKILKDFMKVSPEDAIKSIMMSESLDNIRKKIFENADDYFLYSLYSLKMLLEIVKNSKLSSAAKDDLIGERQKSLLMSAIVDVAKFGIEENLDISFKTKQTVFRKRPGSKPDIFRLKFLVDSFYPLMCLKELRVGKSLDDVQLSYMASIYSLLNALDTTDSHLDQSDGRNLQDKLQNLWVEHSKKLYFRNLMLLYACLPKTHVKRIHSEMLLRLWSAGGFVALLFAMAESQHEEVSLDETVSNLVAQPNFSMNAQQSLIRQILQFLETSINKDFSAYMGAALLSLRKLHDIREENRKYIQNWVLKKMEPLIKADMSAIVAMEWVQFSELISLIYHIFCTSSIGTIPSDLLVPYLPLILDLYRQLECHINQNTVSNHLHSIILKILNNRSKEELKKIIESAALKSFPNEWYQLSENIKIIENPLNMQELKLSVVEHEPNTKLPLASLVAILTKSSYNLLIYQHFLILLQLLPSVIINTNSTKTTDINIDLLTTEEDIYNKLMVDFSLIYENKIQIIKALETLVQHQPLKTLINENIKELLKALQDILFAYSKILYNDSSQAESNSEVLMILIILIREIIENCAASAEDVQTNLHKPLKILESQLQNKNVKLQINCILKTINGEESYSSQNDISRNEFEESRSLIESNEAYMQVQGIEMMIKLLRKRDAFTLTNVHILTALALNTLKSPESYTFLNCVRLFVALVYVNESEVLNLLSDEYSNEAAAMDYRLIIGEVILKVSKELGPLCYRYKNVLLNTYMAGCRSPLNEFRFSAFANLSQMCRQLTYQVHNYFQELLNLIDCEITTGNYLPSKRAAVMVLSDLLAGMDNLFDYEEMLLPIYRLLKYLVASEKCDEKMRMHASNGLRCLSEKCKELLKAGLEQAQHSTILEKEIKIMGIHDKSRIRQIL